MIMSTTMSNTTPSTELEQLIHDGYDAAEWIAQLLYAALTAQKTDAATIAEQIFQFAFEAGLQLGHEVGHLCAEQAKSE